jgi:hypothetical protein
LNDHEELRQLFDALMTIGKVLKDLSDGFDFIIDNMIKRVKALAAATKHDRDMKALTLGAWEIFCGSAPNELIAVLAPLATDKH